MRKLTSACDESLLSTGGQGTPPFPRGPWAVDTIALAAGATVPIQEQKREEWAHTVEERLTVGGVKEDLSGRRLPTRLPKLFRNSAQSGEIANSLCDGAYMHVEP